MLEHEDARKKLTERVRELEAERETVVAKVKEGAAKLLQQKEAEALAAERIAAAEARAAAS